MSRASLLLIGLAACGDFTGIDAPEGAPILGSARFAVDAGSVLCSSLSGSDPEGEALTFATVDGPAHGSVTLTGGDGHFVYTPDPDYVGRDSFTVVATDPVGEATEAKVDLTILGR